MNKMKWLKIEDYKTSQILLLVVLIILIVPFLLVFPAKIPWKKCLFPAGRQVLVRFLWTSKENERKQLILKEFHIKNDVFNVFRQ